MTKLAIKNENVTSFGGIYHIMDVFSKLGFEKLTESVLGKRGSSGKAFSHGSIFGSLFFSYLCGGECLEDINALIGQFKQRPDTLLPGADTVGRGLKELAEENIIYKSEISGKSYSVNKEVLTEDTLGMFIDCEYPMIATARLSGMIKRQLLKL